MGNKKTLRAPVSQKSLVVEKPENPEYIGGTVSIEINEKKVSVPLGTTILEACRQNQIHIPTLCHHEDLCVAGVCRICVVEVEGMRTLQAS
ncbi:MAG: (2Fe-2S)-binding protein, partial [Ignavibacteriaceae bacterium]|nr:(2Fe-2S)-binding protein [Ignavibacteriaceae bacterium]